MIPSGPSADGPRRTVLAGPSAVARRSLGFRLWFAGGVLIAVFAGLVFTGSVGTSGASTVLPAAILVVGTALAATGQLLLRLLPSLVAREYQAGYTTLRSGSTVVDHVDPVTGLVLRPAGARALDREEEIAAIAAIRRGERSLPPRLDPEG